MRARLGLAVVALASCLMLATPPAAFARQPTADEWVGKAVVPNGRDFTLKDAKTGSPVNGPAEVYRVTQVRGTSVLLATTGSHRLGPKDRVVPLELANAFFHRPNSGQSRRIFQSHDVAVVATRPIRVISNVPWATRPKPSGSPHVRSTTI